MKGALYWSKGCREHFTGAKVQRALYWSKGCREHSTGAKDVYGALYWSKGCIWSTVLEQRM